MPDTQPNSLHAASRPEPRETYRVTAIVSVYKAERFIRGCLEDLVAQTLFRQGGLEIVVVDACSPEDERSIVAEFQERYDHIVYVRSPRREKIYTSWNRGVRMARGRYLTNANSDDRHRRDGLELMADYLDAHDDVALVYADSLETFRPNETFDDTTADRYTTWPDFNYAFLEQACYVGPHPMWRRDLHRTHGLFDERFFSAGDYEFWLRIGKTETFYHYPDVLGLYYNNEQGIEKSYGHNASETAAIHEQYGIVYRGRPFGPIRAPLTPQKLAAFRARCAANEGSLGDGAPAPATMLALAERFNELAAARDWEAAGRLAALGVERFQDEPYAWVLRATSLRLGGELAGAIRAVERSLHLEESPEALVELAQIALAGGDVAKGREIAAHLKSRFPAWTSQWRRAAARDEAAQAAPGAAPGLHA